MTCPATSGIRIQTFHPTMEEFEDFNAYIGKIEAAGAHLAGICKIVPPPQWVPRRLGYADTDALVIPAPIKQCVQGRGGVFNQWNELQKPLTVVNFRQLANSLKFQTPKHSDMEHLEKKYWANLTINPGIYGADVSGSVTDADQPHWNIARLGSILDEIEQDSGVKIEGVNTPYLYFGMWKTSFPWHTEDMDLYSINYIHFGEPKQWYAVPPAHGRKFERLAQSFFGASHRSCPAFLRHKTTLISPQVLHKYGVPFDKITQNCGEIIVTFPYGYHSGFNAGFNCAESTNFASRRWIAYGKRANLCYCQKDSVKINMDVFVRKFEPDKWPDWQDGRAISPHPEDDVKRHRKSPQQPPQQAPPPPPPPQLPQPQPPVPADWEDAGSDHSSTDIPSLTLSDDPRRHCGPIEPMALLREESAAAAAGSAELLEGPPEASAPAPLPEGGEFPSGEAAAASSGCLAVCDATGARFVRAQGSLWSEAPADPAAEAALNSRMALVEPHCAVCAFFLLPARRAEVLSSRYSPRKQCPQSRSAVWLPELLFAKEGAFDLGTSVVDLSTVLQCARCRVAVHAYCYGCPEDTPIAGWLCDRCLSVSAAGVDAAASAAGQCRLCRHRGGALKPAVPAEAADESAEAGAGAGVLETTPVMWAHVACALVVPSVRFGDPSRRAPVLLPARTATEARTARWCSVCNAKSGPHPLSKCSFASCHTYFHPSCAYFSGVLIEVFDWPWPSWITCRKHRAAYASREAQPAPPEIRIGDRVVAKHKNSRYYPGVLVERVSSCQYSVDFQDGSFSEDVPRSSFVDLAEADGMPSVGEQTKVVWTNNEVYSVKYMGCNVVDEFRVRFDTGEVCLLERRFVYGEDEELPTKVRNRLSRCSDQQKLEHLSAGLLDERRLKRKRQHGSTATDGDSVESDGDVAKEANPASENAVAMDANPASENAVAKDAKPASENTVAKDAKPASENAVAKDVNPASENAVAMDANPASENSVAMAENAEVEKIAAKESFVGADLEDAGSSDVTAVVSDDAMAEQPPSLVSAPTARERRLRRRHVSAEAAASTSASADAPAASMSTSAKRPRRTDRRDRRSSVKVEATDPEAEAVAVPTSVASSYALTVPGAPPKAARFVSGFSSEDFYAVASPRQSAQALRTCKRALRPAGLHPSADGSVAGIRVRDRDASVAATVAPEVLQGGRRYSQRYRGGSSAF